MELLLLAVLLMNGKGEGNLSETLKSALDFYRENKQLITTFANSLQGSTQSPQPQPQEESRPTPSESVGDFSLIEEFLKGQKL